MIAGLDIAAALALTDGSGLVLLARCHGATGVQAVAAADAGADLPVALVSFVLTGCTWPRGYEPTILDLAARGFLAARAGPGGPWLSVVDGAALPSPKSNLADYEGQALDEARAFLAARMVALHSNPRAGSGGPAARMQSAWIDADPAQLRRAAFAIAAGVPRVLPACSARGLRRRRTRGCARARTGRPNATDRRAWLLNRQRTVVARVGGQLVKLTVSRSGKAGDPGRLPAAAAVVAGRLARQAELGAWPASQLPRK